MMMAEHNATASTCLRGARSAGCCKAATQHRHRQIRQGHCPATGAPPTLPGPAGKAGGGTPPAKVAFLASSMRSLRSSSSVSVAAPTCGGCHRGAQELWGLAKPWGSQLAAAVAPDAATNRALLLLLRCCLVAP